MHGAKTNVLIVDDDQDLLELMTEIFDQRKYKVITAQDGIEANFKFQNQNFDVVITDIRMPKMDGIAFVKLIRKIKNVPILFISASTDDYKTELELFENIDILSKPFNSSDVLSRVDKLIVKKSDDRGTSSVTNVLEFNQGQVIIAEGSRGDDIYFVKEGIVSVQKLLANGESIHINSIGPGEVIGELSFNTNTNRSANFVAQSKVVLIEIPKEKLNEVLSAQPKWFKILFQTLSRRLNETTALIGKEDIKVKDK